MTKEFYRCKTAILAIFALYSLAKIDAQTILVSEDIKLKNNVNYELLDTKGNSVQLVQEDEKSLKVVCYDSLLRIINSYDLSFPYKKPYILSYIKTDSTLRVYCRYNEDGVTYIDQVQFGKNFARGKIIPIWKSDKGYQRIFPLVVSEDKSKQLLRIQLEADEYYFALFDIRSDSVSNASTFQLDNDQFDMRGVNQSILTNQGVYYAFYVGGKSIKEELNFLRWDHETSNWMSFQEVGLFSTDYKLTYDDKFDALRLIGIYASKNFNQQQGIYTRMLDPNSLLPDSFKLSPFTERSYIDYIGQEKVKKSGFQSFQIKDIVYRNDGGYLVLLEEEKVLLRPIGFYKNNMAPGTNTKDYYFEDIIITSIGSDNKMEWQKLLHKHQYSFDDDALYSSYFIHKNPSGLHLLLNDEIKYEGTVSEYVVNPLGKIERRVLFNTERNDLYLQFRNAYQLSARSLIIPSIRRGILKLVRMDY